MQWVQTILTPILTTNLDNQFLQPIITINLDNRPWLPTLIPILTPHHKRQIFRKSQKHHSLTLQHGSIPTAGDRAEDLELGKGEGGPREGMIAAGLRKGTIAAGPRGKGRLYIVETPFMMMCLWYLFCSVCGISATTCMRVWPSVASWSLGESLTWGWAPLGRSVSRQSPLPHPPTRTRTHSTNIEIIFIGINLEFRDMRHILNHLFREQLWSRTYPKQVKYVP